jgi:aspartyl-tRNA(Asn)/glutamyl-tRNA(Gln) amidotransferase subunit A
MSPLGIGTDLGSSNRLPAYYCGVVGFKSSHGRIPQTNSFPGMMAWCMHVGPLARSVHDVRLALAIMNGPGGIEIHAPPTRRCTETPKKVKMELISPS